MIPDNYLVSLLLADAAGLVLAGYYDIKKVEFSVLAIPPLLAIPLVLYYFMWNTIPAFSLLAIAINGIFVVVMALGRMGYMDIVISVRVPFLYTLFYFANPALVLVGFIAGTTASYLYYFAKYVAPILCPDAKPFGRVVKVKKEAIMLNYVFPPGVSLEADSEKLAKVKRKMFESSSDCVDAVVGVPFIFVFSLGYAVALAVVAMANLL